jgi:hypothetical protein
LLLANTAFSLAYAFFFFFFFFALVVPFTYFCTLMSTDTAYEKASASAKAERLRERYLKVRGSTCCHTNKQQARVTSNQSEDSPTRVSAGSTRDSRRASGEGAHRPSSAGFGLSFASLSCGCLIRIHLSIGPSSLPPSRRSRRRIRRCCRARGASHFLVGACVCFLDLTAWTARACTFFSLDAY